MPQVSELDEYEYRSDFFIYFWRIPPLPERASHMGSEPLHRRFAMSFSPLLRYSIHGLGPDS